MPATDISLNNYLEAWHVIYLMGSSVWCKAIPNQDQKCGYNYWRMKRPWSAVVREMLVEEWISRPMFTVWTFYYPTELVGATPVLLDRPIIMLAHYVPGIFACTLNWNVSHWSRPGPVWLSLEIFVRAWPLVKHVSVRISQKRTWSVVLIRIWSLFLVCIHFIRPWKEAARPTIASSIISMNHQFYSYRTLAYHI